MPEFYIESATTLSSIYRYVPRFTIRWGFFLSSSFSFILSSLFFSRDYHTHGKIVSLKSEIILYYIDLSFFKSRLPFQVQSVILISITGFLRCANTKVKEVTSSS